MPSSKTEPNLSSSDQSTMPLIHDTKRPTKQVSAPEPQTEGHIPHVERQSSEPISSTQSPPQQSPKPALQQSPKVLPRQISEQATGPTRTSAERRALFQRQPSSERHSLPERKSHLEHQSSFEQRSPEARKSGLRRLSDFERHPSVRRRQSYRRQSSFDLPHINSVPSNPDVKRLKELDLKKGVPWWTSQRFGFSVIWFFGFLVLYAQRVNLSIAIVSMVDHLYFHHLRQAELNATNTGHAYGTNTTGNTTSILNVTLAPDADDEKCSQSLETTKTHGEFRWDKPLQGLILGAFFWGYASLQVPAGWLSEKFGAKKVVAVGMFPVAIINLLSPVGARASPYLFLVMRIIMGVGESALYPAAQAFWSKWAPPNERSRLIGMSYAGGQFGNAIIFPIGGFLCAYGFDGGWPSVFYVIGIAGFIWTVIWCIFVHDSPAESPRINELERKYIEISLSQRSKQRKDHKTPWKSIFTSRAVWAIIIAHMCGNYGAYMLLTQIPTYMKEVLKFDIKSNGVFSMLPYLFFWFFIMVSGTLADFLISRNILSVAKTRKLMSCIGMIGPGSFLIATGFMECSQQSAAVVMLTASVGLCGFHFSGYFINHGDVAPAYAGTIFGITNTAATIPGIIAPYVVGALTTNETREEWQIAFYIAAGVYFFGAIYYVFMGLGEVQPWAERDEDEDEDDDVFEGEGEGGTLFGLHEITEGIKEEEEGDDDEKKVDSMATDKMMKTDHQNNVRKDV